MAERKKKKKHGGKIVTGACILALILGGLFLDLGGLGSQLGLPTLGPTEVTQPEPPPAPPEEAPPEDPEPITGEEAPLSLLIRVVGNSIFHGDEEITIAGLQNLLREYDEPGLVWELRDEQAILAVYEEVRVMLMEQDVTFTETSG